MPDLPDRLKDYRDDLGSLAAALAKAQASFPAIKRDKSVRVTSERTGKSYSFKYAPLDSILDAVRKPLADNWLAITQLLDSDANGMPVLVTMLLHEAGGSLSARTPIPHTDGETVQAFGSAITYLRRYALQAMLGIAAEEDDDGNRASGNTADFGSAPAPDPLRDGLIGTARKEKRATTDFELRQSPEGAFIGFRLKDGDGTGVICEVRGPMAEALKALEASVIDAHVQVWGEWVSYEPPTVKYGYKALRVARLRTPDFTLPAPDGIGQAVAASDPSAASGGTPNPTPTDAAGGMAEEAPQSPASSSTDTSPEGAGGPPETAEAGPLPVVQAGVVGGTDEPPAAALCRAVGSDFGTVCGLPKGHANKHKELATDGRVLAAW